ncbi:MAG: glycoside hydrolase domain-containing protein, partial [Rhodanobacteraceae bacterium]
ELQLLTWLMPKTGSDIAQSLYNQARQNGGVWDRWTHESGGVHVMTGDPSGPALADIVAFGGRDFDLHGAYASLKRAATVPTAGDLTDPNCNDGNIGCVGQRPSLDLWMKLHYIPTKSRAWGGAGETLEDATADFALSQLAAEVGDREGHTLFLARSGYWSNLFNPHATPEGGYIQNRNADGAWPAFTPDTETGFVEGTASQYLWMVPFNEHGLFDLLGGTTPAAVRLDRFFHHRNGTWALTNAGPLHSEMNNEPSLEVPWLYDYAGQPWKTQETVHAIMARLWRDTPDGIPGEDDLGEMSSWYVWAALGLYPVVPGRAELLIGSPLFPHVVVHRPGGDVTINAPGANCSTSFVHALTIDGRRWDKPWLPATFAGHGGTLDFKLGARPDKKWGSGSDDAPPSFPPPDGEAARK